MCAEPPRCTGDQDGSTLRRHAQTLPAVYDTSVRREGCGRGGPGWGWTAGGGGNGVGCGRGGPGWGWTAGGGGNGVGCGWGRPGAGWTARTRWERRGMALGTAGTGVAREGLETAGDEGGRGIGGGTGLRPGQGRRRMRTRPAIWTATEPAAERTVGSRRGRGVEAPS